MGPRRYSALALCEAAARRGPGLKGKRKKGRAREESETTRSNEDEESEGWRKGSECEIGEKEEDRGWKRRRTDERTWPGHVTAATTEDINQRAHCARG